MPKYPTPVTTTRRFIERINAHDVDGIVALLGPDHRFVDSLGATFQGRDTLRTGWTAYLRMVPDYTITIERMMRDGSDVLVVGTARGTYSRDGSLRAADTWSTPGAWLARVHRGLIDEWRVFADNEQIRRRIRESAV